jgi:hypothetical protein
MAITLRRQVSDDEKNRIIEIHGRKCFATGHDIREDEPVHFDHIKAFSNGGASDIDNIAPMCEHHNKQKGRLPLYDYRIRLKMDDFFNGGDALTLKHELHFLKSNAEIKQYGNPVNIVDQHDNKIIVEINNKNHTFSLYDCPITQWKYFFALLPVDVIDSDDDEDNEIGLQPRYLIFDKVFNLFRHFQVHPVLQPSICRLHKNKILVFDGQHKIAGLLWGGREYFECKVYINPDPKLLNKTNISAHDKFAQTRFYSSIMVAKLGTQFGKEFEEYKHSEDNGIKSEYGFIQHLKDKEKLTNADINKRFRSFLFNAVLDESNKMAHLVSKGNRGSSDAPITMDMLQKSLFSSFLYSEPLDHDMTSSSYLRGDEIDNMIQLLNIMYEEALSNWKGSRPSSDSAQNKLNRMFRSKSIMAWSEIFQDAICAKLNLLDSEDRAMPFYRKLSDEAFENIRIVIRRLTQWPVWQSPQNSEIDRVLSDNKSAVKKHLKDKGLTTGYLMGAPE